MTDKETMKLALDALETEVSIDWTNNDEFNASAEKMHEAITAIKARLADHMREVQRLGQEIEQEPLAHWSDCAVHSEPAYPKSECDCGGIVAVADYTALSDKYVALSDKYVALKAQHKEQEPVAWLLTDKNINSLQVDSIQRLINRLNHAHHTDLCVRINGQDEWFEADWLKHMVIATSPQRKPLTDEQVISKALHLSGLGTSPDVLQFARAIEAAHGIKENT
jgi:predicted translin family RNA/ssDNA-binding protein